MVNKNDGAESAAPAEKKRSVASKAGDAAAKKAPAKAPVKASDVAATIPAKKAGGTAAAGVRAPKKTDSAKNPATTTSSVSAAAPKTATPTIAESTTRTAKKPAVSESDSQNAETGGARAAKSTVSKAVASNETGGKVTRSRVKSASASSGGPKPESVLKVHHLRPAAGSKKERTRVGRGEASKGKTAGRGTKGTKARYQVRPGFEGGNLNSVMRAPKLRGFTNPFRVEYQVVNLEKLAELYPSGGTVTVSDLVGKGVVRKNEKVKVLGEGNIAVKLNVAVDKVSSSAEKKIVAAGGSIQ